MDIYQELNKGIRTVESLIRTGRFQEAYDSVNKLLLNFPDHRGLHKLKAGIEKTVYEHNLKTVKSEMKELKPLWKSQQYDELIKKLTAITKYVPGYEKAEKELYKAQKLYKEQIVKQQKGTLENYLRTIEASIKNQEFEKAMSLCYEVLRKIPQHEKCGMLLAKAKNLLVNQRIKENEILLKSDKFDEIQDFLKELQKICPDSIRVKNLLKKIDNKEKITMEYAKKDFVFSAFEQIMLLYQKGKYDKTIDALRELLEVEPDNLKALDLLKKAEKKFTRQLDKEVRIKIKNLQKKFRKEKKKNPKGFTRI